MPSKRKSWPVRVFALLGLMTLGGCLTSNEDTLQPVENVALPDPPEDIVAPCPDPGVRAGQPALVELARNRVALATCRDRHGRLVAFYEDVKEGREASE